MHKTDIEWCDMTWNPVTGCLHDCEYCYARGIAHRFKGYDDSYKNFDSAGRPCGMRNEIAEQCGKQTINLWDITRWHSDGLPYPAQIFSLDRPLHKTDSKGVLRNAPYPFNFNPTFHRYRLTKPAKNKTPTICFVGSMCDLFGEWIPDEWIQEVFKACEAAPQHRYLFLTKNGRRYTELQAPSITNAYFGTTITKAGGYLPCDSLIPASNMFVSIEPIHEPIKGIGKALPFLKWVIIGAETKNGKVVNPPPREWIQEIVDACRSAGTPVFLKDSLAAVWGEPLIREYPWEV